MEARAAWAAGVEKRGIHRIGGASASGLAVNSEGAERSGASRVFRAFCLDGGAVLRPSPEALLLGEFVCRSQGPEPHKACGSPAKPSTAAVQPFDSRAHYAQ